MNNDLSNKIDLFHQSVDHVNDLIKQNETPTISSSVQGYEYAVFNPAIPIDAREIRTITDQAREIILSLSGDCKGLDELRDKLQDKEWSPPSSLGDREHLQEFYDSCTILFSDVFPKLEKSPFSKKRKDA